MQFVFPFDYCIHEFPTENEACHRVWNELMSNDISQQFINMESQLEMKHRALVDEIGKWSQSIVNIVGPAAQPIYTPVVPPKSYSAVLVNNTIPHDTCPPVVFPKL